MMNNQQTIPDHSINPEILFSPNGFPAPAAEHSPPISAEQMLRRLAGFFRQYLHCSGDQLTVLSLWTLHTHCFSAAPITPYLNVCSREKQSGKSLCLELLRLVCADPWHSTGITAGALVRKERGVQMIATSGMQMIAAKALAAQSGAVTSLQPVTRNRLD